MEGKGQIPSTWHLSGLGTSIKVVLAIRNNFGLDIYTHGEVVWEASASQTPYLLSICEL